MQRKLQEIDCDIIEPNNFGPYQFHLVVSKQCDAFDCFDLVVEHRLAYLRMFVKRSLESAAQKSQNCWEKQDQGDNMTLRQDGQGRGLARHCERVIHSNAHIDCCLRVTCRLDTWMTAFQSAVPRLLTAKVDEWFERFISRHHFKAAPA